MHLIYVTAAAPFSFGEAFIAPEITELQRRGHDVTVVPLRPRRAILHADAASLARSTIREPLVSWRILFGGGAELVRAPWQSLRAVQLVMRSRGLLTLLKNVAVLPKGLWLARIARRRRADHIHAHWLATTSTTALVASVVSGIPWSFTAHRWDIAANNLIEEKAKTARFARAIDIQGASELATFMGVHDRKLRVIHMGVEPGPSRPPLGEKPTEALRVVMGAHLFEKKGHVFAIEAMSLLKAAAVDVLLDCVGDGPLRAKLERYVDALGVTDRVRFTGLVSHSDLLVRLHAGEWDVALLPSIVAGKDREGVPVFLVEAMAAAVPVVATATGGIPELLDGGVGLLVPERNASAVAAALTQLTVDLGLRRRLAAAGRRRVLEGFQVRATVSALLERIS